MGLLVLTNASTNGNDQFSHQSATLEDRRYARLAQADVVGQVSPLVGVAWYL